MFRRGLRERTRAARGSVAVRSPMGRLFQRERPTNSCVLAARCRTNRTRPDETHQTSGRTRDIRVHRESVPRCRLPRRHSQRTRSTRGASVAGAGVRGANSRAQSLPLSNRTHGRSSARAEGLHRRRRIEAWRLPSRVVRGGMIGTVKRRGFAAAKVAFIAPREVSRM